MRVRYLLLPSIVIPAASVGVILSGSPSCGLTKL